MAISWLAALKVVPWGKVMEHAPQVLDKARGLIDKHRSGAPAAQPAPSSPDLPADSQERLNQLLKRLDQVIEKDGQLL